MRKKPCLDCRQDTVKLNEHYFLKQEVWDQIHTSKQGFLCIGCAEARLGRKLLASDFANVTINLFVRGLRKSARLTERLTT